MNTIEVFAKAKINLTLDALRKREDQYHELCMIMQTVHLCDQITITRTDTGSLSLSTNRSYLPTNEKNHAYRAALLFLEKIQAPREGLRIVIKKQIPVCSGLAGGSADAAAVLLGLNELFETGFTKEELANIGVQIGADVPFCIYGNTMLAKGIGEQLTPLPPLPSCFVVLAKPSFNISTPSVFHQLQVDKIRLHPDTEGMIQALEQQDLPGVARRLYNVLEAPALQVIRKTGGNPDTICALKNIFLNHGALGTLMSGSGPTVYGIFEQEQTAKQAAQIARQYTKEVFITTT